MIFGRKLEFNEAFNEGIKSLINLRNEYTSLLRYPLNQIFLSFFKEYELYDDYQYMYLQSHLELQVANVQKIEFVS